MGKALTGISKAAMECLESYQWPGNVRELENVLERAVALESGDVIQIESLPRRCGTASTAGARWTSSCPSPGGSRASP